MPLNGYMDRRFNNQFAPVDGTSFCFGNNSWIGKDREASFRRDAKFEGMSVLEFKRWPNGRPALKTDVVKGPIYAKNHRNDDIKPVFEV